MSEGDGRGANGLSERIMADLKDLQRDTVNYVFRRLYEDKDTARRFLIASETGLGKTLIARGVIARVIDHLQGQADRIDILYICSNADIARQNISRLNVTDRADFSLASRITLLPTVVHELEKNDLNFISFTPGTSFNLGSTMGRIEERALLYHLLRGPWELGDRKAPLNVLQGGASTQRFRDLAASFANDNEIDEKLRESFRHALSLRIETERSQGETDIRTRFAELCKRFSRSNARPFWSEQSERICVIGELRGILATSCIEALEPDLIILDEFQRFKHLLDGTDAASELAKGLFEWGDAKTLLLSATPYKMYTLSHEEDDDHYADFLRTLDFLEFGTEQAETPQATLGEYRKALFRIDVDGVENANSAKQRLQSRLKRTTVRTEKLAATEDRNGMLVEVPPDSLRLDTRDLESYLSMRRILDASGVGDAIEYWKSAPYLLNFMDGYILKRRVNDALDAGGEELAGAMHSGRGALLSQSEVTEYGRIDPANARLRSLITDVVDGGGWKLLWVPPSQPYYALEGAFADSAARHFTKRLVFSSWRVVPKVIAAMVSYEAERRMIRALSPRARNSPEARKRRAGLLRFSIDRTGGNQRDGRTAGMPVLGMLYPCGTLSRECDPLRSVREVLSKETRRTPSASQIRQIKANHLRTLLTPIEAEYATSSSSSDEAWYWAAPILLDLHYSGHDTREWFSQDNLAAIWSDGSQDSDDSSGFGRHLDLARQLLSGDLELGRPPDDLVDVLTLIGIAGPGVAALRALERIAGGAESNVLRNSAAMVAWHLRSLFNLPESIALIRSMAAEGEPYWQSVLRYSLDGCLQSALDEYAHILKEFRGTPNDTAHDVAREMCKALKLQASSLSVDHFSTNPGATEIVRDRGSMRGRFALRFGDEKADDGTERTRTSQVREAFNSPFWPFVLATTSVGQEGLDFHTYCHAIVHWNLPSNPVDLEQREGRVHRYKNHAIRKNLAATYELSHITPEAVDPWESLFEVATDERDDDATDMVPYWNYPLEDGAKIERHVPALPLSRDRDRMSALRRSLAAYRMVFGQARQEDLLSYLLARFTDEEVSSYAERLRIDLQPPANGGRNS
jgi:hypothetical protein